MALRLLPLCDRERRQAARRTRWLQGTEGRSTACASRDSGRAATEVQCSRQPASETFRAFVTPLCDGYHMTRVFISYAHTDADTALARNLEKWLAAAGVEPWLDESRNWPGKNLEHAIPAAVEQSDAAIFLISRAWIERDWTHKEIQLFAGRDPGGDTIPRIGVFRAPRRDLEIGAPAELSRFVTLDWIDGCGRETEAETLYRLYCGIVRQEPGSPSGWVAKGLPFMNGVGGVTPSAPPRLHCRPVRPDPYPSLECGRANEFMSVKQSYAERYHQVAVIAAPTGEAHDRFQRRIRQK